MYKRLKNVFLKIQANFGHLLISKIGNLVSVQYEDNVYYDPQSLLVVFINNLLTQITVKVQPHTLGYIITLPMETLRIMILLWQHVN